MNAAINCFIPGMRHMMLYDIVDLMIRQGYMHRSPTIGPKYFDEARRKFQAEREELALKSSYHEPLTTSVIGCSGIGKSCGVLRVLSLYDQVIDHKPPFVPEPIRQVVYLKVETPGTVKALCASIIAELGRVVGIDYAAEYVRPRATLESLQSRVVNLMALHRVGILVLDEMQNLVSKHKNRDEIFNFIVYLSNALDVPLLFIGTPKLMRFMGSNLRTARRFGSFGISTWNRYQHGSDDWNNFIAGLWKLQVLKDAEPAIPKNVDDALYRCSQGIVDVLVKLFILSQMKSILYYCTSAADKERLTPELIEKVFRTDLANIAPMIDALNNGDEKAIERFEDIAMPPMDFANKVGETYALINKATESMGESTRIQDESNEVGRRFETIAKLGSYTDFRSMLELMRDEGISPGDALLMLGPAEVPQEGEKKEVTEGGMTLSDDFSPRQGEIA